MISSPIQEFYRNKCIFISGGTGFMGKILVEKLLRSCGDLERIYLLVREKKGKTIQERFDEIFDCIIFDRLKQEKPGFLSKVALICGDCSKKKMAILEDDLETLRSKVHIVFHTAAIVNFEATLTQSVRSNLCATKEFIELASTFQNLETFVFVSTAYSNGYRSDVEEKVYKSSISPADVIRLCESMSEEKLAEIVPSLMKGFPNTYTFSKCLAENLMLQYKEKMPIVIVRPSQVTSIAFEPTPGWIGNYYGPTGILSAAGIGLMRTFMMDKRCLLDIVPCDMAINLLVAIPWRWNRDKIRRKEFCDTDNPVAESSNVGTQDQDTDNSAAESSYVGTKDQGVIVYNFVSGRSNPITYQDFLEKSIRYLYKDPPEKCLWSLIFITTASLRMYKLLHILLHLIPGHVVDTYLRLAGKEPRMVKIYNKMKKITLLFKSFTMCEWNFNDSNVQQLWQDMNVEDQSLFPFNVKALNWDQYVESNARGIRLYVLRDKNEHSQYAKRRYMMLRAANAALWTSLTVMLGYGLSHLLPKSKL